MKFEQLLKIICKRYSLLFFVIISLLLPSVLLFVGGEWSDGRGQNVNRHTELLWCWLCFQNIFWGLVPIAGSWVFILFCFHIVLLALKHLWRYLWYRKGMGGVVSGVCVCVKSKYCEPVALMYVSFLVASFLALVFYPVSSAQDVVSEGRALLIVFRLIVWHLSRICLRNAVWN